MKKIIKYIGDFLVLSSLVAVFVGIIILMTSFVLWDNMFLEPIIIRAWITLTFGITFIFKILSDRE